MNMASVSACVYVCMLWGVGEGEGVWNTECEVVRWWGQRQGGRGTKVRGQDRLTHGRREGVMLNLRLMIPE